MDTAVALVRSYLQANGFFTVTEYPILELLGDEGARTVTDVDVIGIRFPGAGDSSETGSTVGITADPDPLLDIGDDVIEVVIGEVKEGAAVLNKSARDPEVLAAVLRRLGRIDPELSARLIDDLIATGEAHHPAGIRIRLMVFASKPPNRKNYRYTWVSHGRIANWLSGQVSDNWDAVKTIQSKDPALGFLLLFEKARRGEE